MAIHELDELMPIRTSASGDRVGTYSGLLAGDVEQTSVAVELRGWRDGKEATFVAWFTIEHNGAVIAHVHMPPGWRAAARQIGLDDEVLATEGYLETMARIEFARRGGR